MFRTLVASGPQVGPRVHQFLLSVSCHGVAVAGAIALARQASPAATSPHSQPALVFVAPQLRQQSPPAQRDRGAPEAGPTPSWEPFPQMPDLSAPALPTTLPRVADLLRGVSPRAGSSPANVVDTLGRAEPGSLRALKSTRPEFEAAARAAVLGSRYRPARVHGHVVRQLVRQTFGFRLDR